jgi:hypothetical protein
MISAVTLIISNMERSCKFYSNIPGFKLLYGGGSKDSFTTYQIGKYKNITYVNLELKKLPNGDIGAENKTIISVELFFIPIMLINSILILRLTNLFQV